ncbi:MAG: hypothetical protein IIA66_10505 [Planctomycetes bacterium]|nr:hypothetical protein [Planctomycetota bacterium]
MQALYDKWRPTSWDDVCGQPKALATINRLRQQRGTLAGDCYLITGQSGTGKTSIALLIANEVSDPWDGAITEFDDPSEINAAELRRIAHQRRMRPLGKGYCVIVNEAHGLQATQVRKLLGLTERLPAWLTWVFTTTCDGQEKLFDVDDSGPLLSRCKKIRLARRGLSEVFAERARTIAQSEGLDGRPIADYVALLKRCRNNLRSAIQEIECGAMLGEPSP